MFLVGLTGGIGSGKSTIASRLQGLGAIVLSADDIAAEAVGPNTQALRDIVQTFGTEVLDPGGALNRQQLARMVFDDNAKLKQLNGIVHPAVRKLTADRLAQVEQAHPDAIVVYDVPLLIEANVDHAWDYIVVAVADEETRIERLVSLRGMTREQAVARIAAQADDDQRRAIADRIIDTGGSLEHTHEQVDALYEELQALRNAGS